MAVIKIILSNIVLLFVILNYVELAITNKQETPQQQLNTTNAITIIDPANISNDDPQTSTNELSDVFKPYEDIRNTEFDWKLSKEMLLNTKIDNQKNMIFSTFSIKLLLVILAEAADESTTTHRELIGQTLPSIKTIYDIRIYFQKILNTLLMRNEFFDMRIGSKIFIDNSYDPNQIYRNIIERYYDTTMEKVDFQIANSLSIAEIMNEWCSTVTDNKIKNIFRSDDIDFTATELILLNVMYFNGYWVSPFAVNENLDSPFYYTPTETLRTLYMKQNGNFYYGESVELDSRILRLPYKGDRLAMYIILPNAKAGLDECIRRLGTAQWYKIQKSMELTKLDVQIPKFKFDFSQYLNQLLESIGITEIFTSSATLSALSRKRIYSNNQMSDDNNNNYTFITKDLFVSKILQKSGIDVNEKGSSVQILTEIELTNKFSDTNAPDFIANRPFAFLIEDEPTGTILYMGKVVKPSYDEEN